MNFKYLLLFLWFITSPIFSEEAGSVNVYITIPSTNEDEEGEGESPEQISITTFYAANHQYYSLTPSDIAKSVKQKAPLLEKALFELSSLFKAKCLALPLLIEKQKSSDPLLISIFQEQTDSFKLLSIDSSINSIAVKLYLIDLTKSLTLENITELRSGQKYFAKDMEGKVLFMVMLDNVSSSDVNKHYLPLKVHYESL